MKKFAFLTLAATALVAVAPAFANDTVAKDTTGVATDLTKLEGVNLTPQPEVTTTQSTEMTYGSAPISDAPAATETDKTNPSTYTNINKVVDSNQGTPISVDSRTGRLHFQGDLNRLFSEWTDGSGAKINWSADKFEYVNVFTSKEAAAAFAKRNNLEGDIKPVYYQGQEFWYVVADTKAADKATEKSAETPANKAGQKAAHNSVKAAATKTAAKKLPKTSAAK